jgi:hypothetical protein
MVHAPPAALDVGVNRHLMSMLAAILNNNVIGSPATSYFTPRSAFFFFPLPVPLNPGGCLALSGRLLFIDLMNPAGIVIGTGIHLFLTLRSE